MKGCGERVFGSLTFHVSPFTLLESDTRTPLGERRVSARRGWAGEKSDFFSILLKFWNAQCFADHQGSG
jgi:hypothetical protein